MQCLHCLLLLGPWDLAEDKSPNPLGAGSAGACDARSLALGQHRMHRRLEQGRDRFVTGLHVQRSVKKSSLSSTTWMRLSVPEQQLVPFHCMGQSVLLDLKLSPMAACDMRIFQGI